MHHYRAPAWLPSGHAQTIWPALFARTRAAGAAPPAYRRERWDTPDGDFIDVDFLEDALGKTHETSAPTAARGHIGKGPRIAALRGPFQAVEEHQGGSAVRRSESFAGFDDRGWRRGFVGLPKGIFQEVDVDEVPVG
ncbi:MAG: hypothetical protein ACKOER_06845, partial [Betaproteobacteria bacterium]